MGGGHSRFSQPWLNEAAGPRDGRKAQRVDPSRGQLLLSPPGSATLASLGPPGARAHPLQLELDLAGLEHDGSPHRILHSLHLRVHGLKRKDALAPAPLGPHLEHCRGLGGSAALTTAPRARGPGTAAPPDQCRCPLHRAPAQGNLDTKRKRTNTSRTTEGGTSAPTPKASQGPFQRAVPAWLRGRVPIPRRLGPSTAQQQSQSSFAKAAPNARIQRACCRRLATPRCAQLARAPETCPELRHPQPHFSAQRPHLPAPCARTPTAGGSAPGLSTGSWAL